MPTQLQLAQKGHITDAMKAVAEFEQVDPEVISQYKAIQSEHLSFIETDNVIPLLLQADVMVCDTSSVIPMFLVQNKPVVTYKNLAAKL